MLQGFFPVHHGKHGLLQSAGFMDYCLRRMQAIVVGSSKIEPQTFPSQTETPVFTGVLPDAPAIRRLQTKCGMK